MKNKKRRKDLIKPIRRLSYISMFVFLICLTIGMFFGDLIYSGVFVLVIGLVLFLILQIVQYQMMHKCRCRACGHTEIFKNKWIIIKGFQSKCEKCKSDINIDEVIE